MIKFSLKYSFYDKLNDITSYHFENKWNSFSKKVLLSKNVNTDNQEVLKKSCNNFDIYITPNVYLGSKNIPTPFNLVCAYISNINKNTIPEIEIDNLTLNYNKATVASSIINFLEEIIITGLQNYVKQTAFSLDNISLQTNTVPTENSETILLSVDIVFLHDNNIYKRFENETVQSQALTICKTNNIKQDKLKVCILTKLKEYLRQENDILDVKEVFEKNSLIQTTLTAKDIIDEEKYDVTPAVFTSLCIEYGLLMLTPKIFKSLEQQKKST